MADHFLGTPEYEQSKNLCLVYVKRAESVKKNYLKIEVLWVGWSGPRQATLTPPVNKIPGSAPEPRLFYVSCFRMGSHWY